MMKLNNKGQTLVLFVVLLPIVLFILTLVYDVGMGLYEKEKLSNVNYMAVDYGLSNMDDINDSELIDLIMMNTTDLSGVLVDIDNDTINIKINKDIKGIMGSVFGFNVLEVNSEYEGKIINEEKKIERIK